MDYFKDGINVTAILGIVLSALLIVMCFLPFFVFKTDTALTGETKNTASGFDTIFGLFCKENNNSNKSDGMENALKLYNGDKTKGTMMAAGIAGLLAFLSALTLLVLFSLTFVGKGASLKMASRAVGTVLAITAPLTLILAIITASNAPTISLGSIASSSIMTGFALWVFTFLGIAAGLTAFCKHFIRRRTS